MKQAPSKALRNLRRTSYAFMAVLLLGIGWGIKAVSAQRDMQALLEAHEVELREMEVVRNKNTSLRAALDTSSEANSVLMDQLAVLRERPAEVRYITKIETVVKGTTTMIVPELPADYTFQLEGGLPVAQFSVLDGPEYAFDTADISIKADLVIAENNSVLSLRMESDLEPGTEYEIPVENLQVSKIREQPVFAPHLLVGAGAHLVLSGGQPGLSGGPHLAVNWFHPEAELRGTEFDLVSTRIGAADGAATFGLDPLVVNVGDPLPVLTNLWIGLGPTIDTQGRWSGTLSVGGKL